MASVGHVVSVILLLGIVSATSARFVAMPQYYDHERQPSAIAQGREGAMVAEYQQQRDMQPSTPEQRLNSALAAAILQSSYSSCYQQYVTCLGSDKFTNYGFCSRAFNSCIGSMINN